MARLENREEIRSTHVFFAVVGVYGFTDADFQFNAIGYLLPGSDQVDLIRTLEDLRNGRQPTVEARRANVWMLRKICGSKVQRLSPPGTGHSARVVDGPSYKMIAAELRISFETERGHIKGINQKIDVSYNTAAVVKAIQEGMLLSAPAA